MSYNILHVCRSCFVVAALFALGVRFAPASNAPLVSGSYAVIRNTDVGSLAQVRIRIHLVNHGPSDLLIQRITLRDFSYSDKGGSHACAVALGAHASAETTQDFTIQRPEYQSWQRGVRPRLLLQMEDRRNTKSKAVVRLDRISRRISGDEVK